MEVFSQNILDIIEKFSYDFFVVQPDENVKCTCVNASSQADPNCKKCLGTGSKIKIKKVRGASVDARTPGTLRATGEIFIARNYYVPMTETIIEKDDIIVDGNEVNFVYQMTDGCGFHGEHVYQKCLTAIKKLDSKIFFKNFNKIVGR